MYPYNCYPYVNPLYNPYFWDADSYYDRYRYDSFRPYDRYCGYRNFRRY